MSRVDRCWARLLVALYPPGFRSAVGTDLGRLLLDAAGDARRRGLGALLYFVLRNTGTCVADATLEWGAAIVDGWDKGRGEMLNMSWLHSTLLVLRGLARQPGYTVPVLLTLALGIGLNTATFTVLNAVVLRPLPYAEPDRVVSVWPVNTERGNDRTQFSLPDIRDWAERTTTLSALGAYQTLNSDLVYTGGDEAREIETAYVTAGFWSALGVVPMLGRTPTAQEELSDNRVIVVSHAFWLQQLGADSSIVGRSLPLSGEDFVVVGVMPASFDFPTPRVGLWAFISIIPESSTPYSIRGLRLLQAVGRLAPDVTIERAAEELGTVARGLADEFPDEDGSLRAASVELLRDGVIGGTDRALGILMTAAFLILVVMCANLANLSLARHARRAPELAVRAALGASGGRLAGLVLAEGLLLALVGGALGLCLAAAGTGVLVSQAGATLPRAHEIRPDWWVGFFALTVSLVTGAAFSLMASVRAGGTDVRSRLRAAERGSVLGGMRGALVVSQVSLSVALLVGAGLLVGSLRALGAVDLGFRSDGLLVADITFASGRFPSRPEYLARFDATLEAFHSIPGVRSATTVRRFPFMGEGEGVRWRLPGAATDADGARARLLQVGSGYFETMGIPLHEGGDFAPDDTRPLVILSQSVARQAFGGAAALGRTLIVDGDELEVLGVAGDVHQGDLRAESGTLVYVSNRFSPRRGAAFVLRAEPGATVTPGSVRAAMRRIDPDQPITLLAPASDIVGEPLGEPRFFTLLLSTFAGLALVLCAVGVYGVVSFGVSRRKREVGIRLALGAEPAEVRNLVVREGMRPVLAGLAVGLGITLLATRTLDSMLFGVGRLDPAIWGLAVGLLSFLGFVACWLPARRASLTAVDALAGE